MILMTLPQTLSPGLEQWQYFHSSQVKVKGSKNYAGIANPVVDAMLNRLLGAHSRDEQVAAARALTGPCSGSTTAFPTGTSIRTVWRTATASPSSPPRPTPWACARGGRKTWRRPDDPSPLHSLCWQPCCSAAAARPPPRNMH